MGGCKVVASWSLLALRCGGRVAEPGVVILPYTASIEGVYPRYHAVGDDGEMPEFRSTLPSRNIAFGLCILPSEPRLRCCEGMRNPASRSVVSRASISPNRGLNGFDLPDEPRATEDGGG